jgi:hypothetical protein
MSPSGRFRRPARILDAATGGLSEQLARYKPQGSTILHHWQHSNSLWPGFFWRNQFAQDNTLSGHEQLN